MHVVYSYYIVNTCVYHFHFTGVEVTFDVKPSHLLLGTNYSPTAVYKRHTHIYMIMCVCIFIPISSFNQL